MKKILMMLAALWCLSAAAYVVDDKLPAGNIIVERIAGDTVFMRQDQRGTIGESWFYWAFRVTGAAGRRVKFVFTDKSTGGGPVGVRGPLVSTDGGKTFSYPLDGKSKVDMFSFIFPDGVDEVRFYECHPYVLADWNAFLEQHAAARGTKFETGVLCKSRNGVDVPKARFGCINTEAKYRIFMSARHHCSETMASFVLEGMAEAFLKDDALGKWLCANVELFLVPFVDYDGAQAGDQGKRRAPHDHNRDYTEFIYPETKAIAQWLKAYDGKLDVFVDVHCPWIRGRYNEFLYTPWKNPQYVPNSEAEKRCSELLEKLQCGSIRYKASDDLPFGIAWNKGANYEQGLSSIIWAAMNLKGLKICRTYEVPFANANGAVVTPGVCRDLGRDLAKVYRALLAEPVGHLQRE